MKKLLARTAGVLLATVLMLVGGVAKAQFGASLSGTVVDSTQAAIPGATLTLTNTETQQAKTVTSGAAGSYQFSELSPGTYTLTVSATGFQQSVLSGVGVAAETPRSVNVTLQTGQASQTVDVNADTVPLLQTADASISSTIDSDQIQRLPVFGADPYELLRTAPGITGDGARSGGGLAVFLPNGAGPGGSNSGVFQTENQVQISAAGQRVSDNTFLLDGVTVDSLTHGGSAVVTPNEEAVSQITVVSTSYDAGDGRNTGAQIKTVSKSGTNTVHGSLFFLYDEPGLNAYNKFGGPVPGTLPVRNDNQQRTWAASIGGPIIKNKLFFFGSFEEYKQSDPSFTTGYVETPQYRAAIQAQRQGGISESIIADPNSQARIRAVIAPNCTGFAANTCQVVAGGIDVGSLTPGGPSQLGVYLSGAGTPALRGASPLQVGAGLDGIPDLENVQLIVPSQSRGNQYNARVDWQPTNKDVISGSVFFTKLDNLGSSGTAGARPDTFLPFKPLNSAETAIWVHTFSPRWLNEARVNATRFAENGIADSGNTVNFGLPYDNVQAYPFTLQYGVMPASTSPAVFAENTYEARDTVTHVFGSQSLRMGAEFRLEQDNDNLSGNQRPTYAIQGLWQFANDAPVYEQVTVNPVNGAVPNTQRYFRSQDAAAFVQDDWKVTPNLTLNLGVRLEIYTPLRNKGFPVNYPVLGPAGSELSGLSLAPRDYLWNPQYKNIGPRFGFAYTPQFLKNKTVIRGGYALAYNHLDIALFNNAIEDGPSAANFGLCCASGNSGANSAGVLYEKGSSNSPSSFPINPLLALGVNSKGLPNSYTFPGTTTTISPSVELYGADPNLKYPSSDLYSLEIQQDLGYKVLATIGYTGSTGHHYARLVDQNFLYSQTNSPTFAFYRAQTDSVQNYNSLNANLRRTGKGLTVSVAYKYSKDLDEVSNGDGADSNANQTNPAVNRSEYGPSDFDAKHLVVATALYELPHFHTRNQLVSALANGFQVNGTYTYHTGYPWTPVTNNFSSLPFVNGASTINPTRPLGLTGIPFGTSCSNNAYTTGSNFPLRMNAAGANVGGSNYFITTPLNVNSYVPGIGRNSFRGPCYQDVDITVAKEFGFDLLDHHSLFRFQANMFNVLNILQLQPLTNGNANGGSNIGNQYFGYSQAADDGRVIEFLARIQF